MPSIASARARKRCCALAVLACLPAAATDEARTFGERTLSVGGPRPRRARVLQSWLTKRGFRTRVDGRFGSGTRRSVRRYERRAGPTADSPRRGRRAAHRSGGRAARPGGAATEFDASRCRRGAEDGFAERPARLWRAFGARP